MLRSRDILRTRMRDVDLIRKKRDSGEHTREEIDFLISGYTRGEIPDYQISAWLMAAWLRGLNRFEIAALTESMLYSGEVLNLADLPGRRGRQDFTYPGADRRRRRAHRPDDQRPRPGSHRRNAR